MILYIKSFKPHIPYEFLFQYFGVSSSSYYDWKRRQGVSHLTKKSDILSLIRQIFKESKNTYGSPRVHAELIDRGVEVSENTQGLIK
jgi:putative transposase